MPSYGGTGITTDTFKPSMARAVSGLSGHARHCQSMDQEAPGTQTQPEELPSLETVIDSALAANSAELVERIRSGDALVWRELVDQYEPLLRRIASRYRLSSQDAEDVVQITWLRCVEHIDQLSHADRFRAWLGTICRRECLRLATRGRREVALGEVRLKQIVFARIGSQRDSLRRVANSIRLLGPQQTLERGYSITLDANRNVVRSAGRLKVGDTLCNRFADGEAYSVAVRLAGPKQSLKSS